MPQVPSYGGPQVRDAASQPVYQDAGRYTQGARTAQQIGAGLMQAGEVIDAAVTREAQQQAYDAETKIRADWLLFEQEARKTRQGEKAKGLTGEAEAWWAKAAETYGKDMSPMARRLASRSLAQARMQATANAGAFENQQLEAALDQSWAASKLVAISNAAANPAPAEIEAAAIDLKRKNAEQAARRGWSPDVLAAETLKDTTTLHANVLDGLMQRSPEAAKAYFARHQADIDGKLHDNIQEKLDRAGKAETALRIGAELAQKFDWTRSTDALAAIDALNEPAEVKQAIRQDVLQRHTIAKADADQRNADSTKRLMAAVAQGATLAQLQKMPQWGGLQDGGAAIMDYLDRKAATLETRLAARESRAAAAESRAEARLLRQERAQERATMGAYMRYSDPDVLQAMSRPQIEALLPTLGAENTSRLLARKDQFTRAPEKLVEARIDKQDFDHVAATMGLKPYDPSKSEKQRVALGELQYRVETLIDRAQAAKKAPLTREEKMELMRGELARTVTINGFFSNDTKPVIQLTPEELRRVVVPPEDRLMIEQALKARGMPVDDAAVRRLYALRQSRAAELIPDVKR